MPDDRLAEERRPTRVAGVGLQRLKWIAEQPSRRNRPSIPQLSTSWSLRSRTRKHQRECAKSWRQVFGKSSDRGSEVQAADLEKALKFERRIRSRYTDDFREPTGCHPHARIAASRSARSPVQNPHTALHTASLRKNGRSIRKETGAAI